MNTHKELVTLNDNLLRELYAGVYYIPNRGYQCITCGKFTQSLEVGHLYGRDNKAIRYHFHATAPQCRKCNNTGNGERKFYEWMIIYRYGKTAFDKMTIAKSMDAKMPFLENVHNELVYLISENLPNKEFLRRIGEKNPALSKEEIEAIRKDGKWEVEWKILLNHF